MAGIVEGVEYAALQDLCVSQKYMMRVGYDVAMNYISSIEFPVSLGPDESSGLRFSSGGCTHSKLCYMLLTFVSCLRAMFNLYFFHCEGLCILD